MTPWLDAFVPAFGLLALGALLRRRLLPDPAFWSGAERLVFYALLPCLLAGAIAAVDLSRLPFGGMALSAWGALAAGTALSLLLARGFGLGHAATTSVLQGGIRFNTIMALAVAGGVFGAPGLAFGAVATGLIVPAVQVITTLAFALGRDAPGGAPGGTTPAAAPGTAHRARPRIPGALRQVASNPLILGCAAGFALSALGGLPPGAGPLVRALGGASVALGLLTVGAALGAGALRDRVPVQAATTALKLLVMPALTLALARLLGVDPLPAAVLALFMAMPTAPTAYVQARLMGGDAPLVAATTTAQHLAAALTLPLWALLLGL